MEQGFKTHPDGTVDRSNGLCNLCVTGCVCAWFYSGCVYGAGRTARPHRICSQSGPLLLGTKSAKHSCYPQPYATAIIQICVMKSGKITIRSNNNEILHREQASKCMAR